MRTICGKTIKAWEIQNILCNEMKTGKYGEIGKCKKFWEGLIAYFPLIRHEPYIKRRVQQVFYCCLSIRSRGNYFTDPLLSNRWILIKTHRLMGEMKYPPSFIKTDSGIQKLRGSWVHRQQGDLISLLLFFQNKEIG
jgi:hypothetical protein